ncbi:MAG: hypothetical protein ACYDEH_12015 [Acidimicrobiales bacterium]
MNELKMQTAKVLVPLAMLIGVVAPMASAGASGLIPQTINLGPGTHFTYSAIGSEWYAGGFETSGASGNPVVFTIDPSSTSGCTINASTDVVTFSAPTGTCVLDANQAGNAIYAAAPQVQEIGTYSLPQQLLNLDTHAPTLYVGMTHQFTVTIKGASGNPVIFKRDGQF